MNQYDLSHLEPHTIKFIVPGNEKTGIPERVYLVEVSYSDHCYTKSVVDRATSKKAQNREFDPARYELSKQLPEIIGSLSERRCSFAQACQRQNYFTISVGEYEVYFEVFKREKSLVLRVQSAYVREPENLINRPKWRPIRFGIILYNVLHAKPVKAAQ